MSEPNDMDRDHARELRDCFPYDDVASWRDAYVIIATYREECVKAERERVLSELRATPHERFHVNGQLQERLADIEDSPDRYDATTRSLAAALGRALRNDVSAAKVERERVLAEVEALKSKWRQRATRPGYRRDEIWEWQEQVSVCANEAERLIAALRGKESGT